MSITLTRRAAALALSVAFVAGLRGKPGLAAAPFPGVRLRDPVPFNFDLLTAEAKKRAAAPYVPEPPRAQALLDRIDFEQHIEIVIAPTARSFRASHSR